VSTIADFLLARAEDDHPGLVFGDDSWSWAEVVQASADRAALATSLRQDGPFHIGVLLENGPEYVFWLGGAALAGATVVGINPTRRGPELARDVAHTDCQLLVTDAAGAGFLGAAGVDVAPERVLKVDEAAYGKAVADVAGAPPDGSAAEASSLFLLLFTSGSTGAPKAVRCTQGRLAAIGERAAELYGIGRGDVYYCAMPLFHGNAIMAVWAPVLRAGSTFATRPKFSASAFLDDVRRFGATHFNYVGKSLAYVLATPERPDDADNPLKLGFGTEASERDISEFRRRFKCMVVEGYGMSEGGTNINVVPGTPKGSLGKAGNDTTIICDPATGAECPRARFDKAGRLLNADEAIGEIVNTAGARGFEGYYANPEADAARVREGAYWTGDLGYRDQEGFFYFAGRSDDWLRVDGENFGAAPVERILFRHPDVVMAAVYATPDPRGGDQLMAALELRPGTTFDPEAFRAFLDEQPDLGTKWAPRFVRITEAMPLTGTNKVLKVPLRTAGWSCDDPVWWRPPRAETYRLLTDADRQALDKELHDHGRARG
jgi:fatty-acyl-CoA synthase